MSPAIPKDSFSSFLRMIELFVSECSAERSFERNLLTKLSPFARLGTSLFRLLSERTLQGVCLHCLRDEVLFDDVFLELLVHVQYVGELLEVLGEERVCASYYYAIPMTFVCFANYVYFLIKDCHVRVDFRGRLEGRDDRLQAEH